MLKLPWETYACTAQVPQFGSWWALGLVGSWVLDPESGQFGCLCCLYFATSYFWFLCVLRWIKSCSVHSIPMRSTWMHSIGLHSFLPSVSHLAIHSFWLSIFCWSHFRSVHVINPVSCHVTSCHLIVITARSMWKPIDQKRQCIER